MFIDCYIDLTDARNIWNRLQAKLGFIREFAQKFQHHDPNSTDIKPVKDQDSMNAYMLKYMMKPIDKVDQLNINSGEEKRDTGKVWDCSLPLKTKNLTGDFLETYESEFLDQLEERNILRSVNTDYAKVYFYEKNANWKYLPTSLKERYQNYLNQVKTLTEQIA